MTLRSISFLICSAATACFGCSADAGDQASDLEQPAVNATQALTSITLSGKVTGANGAGLAGVTVTLAGSIVATRSTDTTGSYSFTGLAAGSYSLRATKNACGFLPDVVNLNNLSSSKTQNFVGSGAGCAQSPKALMLVDQRLYTQLKNELDQYRTVAGTRRGFAIDLRAISGLDDWGFQTVRNYVIQAKSQNAALEGVLYVGNVKLPSFYKPRPDTLQTRLMPVYLEDLDATFSRIQVPGSIDPACDGTNDAACAVGGPATVPAHDLDSITPGAGFATELWAAFMPVGVEGAANSYNDYANQLRPYLNKVNAYYAGQSVPNGRYYFVSNDIGERFDWTWDAFGNKAIDFYGKPGPNGETGDACILANGQNLCYVRWPTQNYATATDFINYFQSQPWVGENWQLGNVFIPQMNAALYSVVEVNTHAYEEWTLINSTEVKALTNAGLLIALDGCSVAGFAQPGSPSYVNTGHLPSSNVAVSYLYGSSKAVASMGSAFDRSHYGNHSLIYREMKVNHAYLGLAHRTRMAENYSRAGSSPLDLENQIQESLLGDPFKDLN